MGTTPTAASNFRIVTLCGSKGALGAYIQILRTVPHDSGMAFVVLTHRRSHRPCRLVTILSDVTRMPVEEIKDRAVLLPNRVYVIPPGKDLTTDGAVFRLAPMSRVNGWPDGFNLFLTSLAHNTHGRAVTIILSGMAEDGSAALGELRLNGGLAFAQADAADSSMPTSAVATGNVDYFCSAADIGILVSALRPLSNSANPALMEPLGVRKHKTFHVFQARTANEKSKSALGINLTTTIAEISEQAALAPNRSKR